MSQNSISEIVDNKAKGRISKRITYVFVSGGKKYSFFGKFGVLCFLETHALRFAFLPYDRRNHKPCIFVTRFLFLKKKKCF